MDNDAIRREAGRILTDPDFQQYREKEEWFDLWKWLKNLFNFKLPFEGTGDPLVWQTVATVLKVLLIVGLVVCVCVVACKLYEKFFRHGPKAAAFHGITQAQRQEAHDMYARLASEALARGDYREAMHYLFLATVSQVIRDARFHGTEYMTNREIAGASDFSRFGNPQQLSGLFQTMVAFDEPRWFGTAKIGEQDFRQFQGFYEQFKTSLQPISVGGRHA